MCFNLGVSPALSPSERSHQGVPKEVATLHKVFEVFKRDLLRVLRNPVALLIVGGICVVPCLYAWINVLANWDPYENTAGVSVAVVTEDLPVEMQDIGEICVGDMMLDALKDNDKVGWQFLDNRDDAIAGVRAGEYYAAIIIPNDFTKDLTSILDGNTDKAHLLYYVNEKVNPVTPKVADTVASTVQNEVDSQFTAKVGEVIAQKLGDFSGEAIDKAQNTVDKGISVLSNISVTLVDVNDELGTLSEKLTTAKDALNSAADSAAGLDGIGANVSGGLAELLNGFTATRTNANSLISQINASLGNGASTISALSSRANYDVSAIAGDISIAQAQVSAAIRALENDLSDSEALTTKLEDAYSLIVSIDPTDESASATRLELEGEISREHDLMVQITADQQARLEELRDLASKLDTVATTAASASESINSKVQTGTNTLSNAQTGIVADALRDIHTSLDALTTSAIRLETAAEQIDPIIRQVVSMTREFAGVLGGATDALGGTRTSLDDLQAHIDSLNGELTAIRSSDAWATLQQLVETNPDAVHDFLSAPVEVSEVALFPVANYGTGVAPFFTSLALWVGGIALVAIFKLEVDEDEVGKLRPWQAYFGRWLFFILLGTLQAIICCTGDLIIGIQCAYPWAFYLSAIVASFVFVNIIYGLSVAFKHLGKALAFTLIILQVPGSAGMYPIEMMPPFFKAIGPWLPFTYSINAMRESIAGFYEWNLGYNLGMLLLFVAPAILLGVTMRRHLININGLFDARLRATDHLMVSEPIAVESNHYRLETVVKALHSPDEYREAFEERSAVFEKAYPSLVRNGIMALLFLPLAIFLLMLVIDAKLPLIAAFVISLICIYVYLILTEFFRDRIQHKRTLTTMSEDELKDVLVETLRNEVMPYAPVDALIERRRARHESRGAHFTERAVGMLHYSTRLTGKDDPDREDETLEGGDEL